MMLSMLSKQLEFLSELPALTKKLKNTDSQRMSTEPTTDEGSKLPKLPQADNIFYFYFSLVFPVLGTYVRQLEFVL
jgi:hypothetical protein